MIIGIGLALALALQMQAGPPPAAPASTHAAAQAQEAPAPRSFVRRLQPGAASPRASLADVAWLQGYWIGEMPEGPVEQVRLPPARGQMPAFVRALNDGGIIFYEITTLVERDGSLVIRLRHFGGDLVGWEDGSGAIERPLIAIEGGNLYFDRMTMIRTDADHYTVYFLNMADGVEGETLVIPFQRRVL